MSKTDLNKLSALASMGTPIQFLVEAARIELASKTVGPEIPTSVSSVLFLDGDLSRGRLTARPVRFI